MQSMRLTQLFTKTSHDVPADETARNAQLLIQAGFIHKEMAGVYAYLPLGLRVLENIKQIVREEMNAIGGQEVMMTALQPRDLWEKTDRWDDAKVDNWFKTKLKNGTELGVGLTHEEPIVDALSAYATSYKDMPIYVYQIQNKFRNELRAKSGLLRGREFVMKDMYSFARSQKEHDELYEKVAIAYSRVYQRLGIGDITYRTKADGGYFTERFSDEYQTLSDIGEDTIFETTDHKFYNGEVAPSQVGKPNAPEAAKDYREIHGEDIIGVEALLKHLDIPIEKSTKTLVYTTDTGQLIVAAVRSDYSINEIKLCKVLGCRNVRLATEAEVERLTSAKLGYAGIVNLPEGVMLILDDSLQGLCNFETGSNKTGYHSVNVNFDRDQPAPEKFYDIKQAKQGDLEPETGKTMAVHKAVEVGNIFPLETKYTDALGVYYTDETGGRQSIVMGCYGIGISRLMGVLAEYFADEKGLIWPAAVAPAQVYLARLGDKPEVVQQADGLYDYLTGEHVGVLYDDRDVRPGGKFADADLMGIPWRLVVSEKTVASGTYELKARQSTEVRQVSREEVVKSLAAINQALL